MPAFRIRGKRFLFTWSQVPLTLEHIDVWQTIDNYASLSKAIIAREAHADGGVHYHAYAEFVQALDRSLTDQLDCGGVHPNIAPKRTRPEYLAAAEYTRKDVDWIEYGDFESDDPGTGHGTQTSITEAAQACASFAEFIQWGIDNHVAPQYIKWIWDDQRTQVETIREGDPVDGTVTHDLLLDTRWSDVGSKTVVLVGPSGCGKTTWARKELPRPVLFISHIDSLKSFVPGYHRSIIFDDMCFVGDENGKGRWPLQAQIHLVDSDHKREIHCRYTAAVIPAGINKCFTCNVNPFVYHDAITRRIEYIDLNYMLGAPGPPAPHGSSGTPPHGGAPPEHAIQLGN